jgi:hypothetical protein
MFQYNKQSYIKYYLIKEEIYEYWAAPNCNFRTEPVAIHLLPRHINKGYYHPLGHETM